MSAEDRPHDLLEAAPAAAEDLREIESLDDENTLTRDFVRLVREALDAGRFTEFRAQFKADRARGV